jgi:hypothetical protein
VRALLRNTPEEEIEVVTDEALKLSGVGEITQPGVTTMVLDVLHKGMQEAFAPFYSQMNAFTVHLARRYASCEQKMQSKLDEANNAEAKREAKVERSNKKAPSGSSRSMNSGNKTKGKKVKDDDDDDDSWEREFAVAGSGSK